MDSKQHQYLSQLCFKTQLQFKVIYCCGCSVKNKSNMHKVLFTRSEFVLLSVQLEFNCGQCYSSVIPVND